MSERADETDDPAASGMTLAGMRAGALMTLPMTPGIFAFGLAIGALSAQRGLTLFETWALTTFLNAGAAQAVAYQVWPEVWSAAALIAVVGVVFTVNARLMLMSASFRPWLGNLPARQVYPSFAVFTDMNWSLGVAYHARGGRDAGMLVGAGLFTSLVWSLAAFPGWLMVAHVADPRVYALDLMLVVMFSTMSIPVMRRARALAPFVVAGVVALAVGALAPGFWFIVAGALAGAVAGATRLGDG